MVQLLYLVAAALAVWGVAILASGELVAMLDIATSLFASGAIVLGLAAVASALNRIARAMHRFEEAARLQHEPAMEAQEEGPIPGLGGQVRTPRQARPTPAGWTEEPAGQEPEAGAVPASAWEDDLAAAYAGSASGMHESRAPAAAQRERDAASSSTQSPDDDATRVIRSGTLNGVLYRFFADGSVEAVTGDTPRRFASVDELRESILAARSEAEPDSPVEPPLTGEQPRTAAEPEENRAAAPVSERKVDDGAIAAMPTAMPVVAPPVRPDPSLVPEPPPAEESPVEESPISIEMRLDKFEADIWAATLAELRKPLDDAREASAGRVSETVSASDLRTKEDDR